MGVSFYLPARSILTTVPHCLALSRTLLDYGLSFELPHWLTICSKSFSLPVLPPTSQILAIRLSHSVPSLPVELRTELFGTFLECSLRLPPSKVLSFGSPPLFSSSAHPSSALFFRGRPSLSPFPGESLSVDGKTSLPDRNGCLLSFFVSQDVFLFRSEDKFPGLLEPPCSILLFLVIFLPGSPPVNIESPVFFSELGRFFPRPLNLGFLVSVHWSRFFFETGVFFSSLDPPIAYQNFYTRTFFAYSGHRKRVEMTSPPKDGPAPQFPCVFQFPSCGSIA